MRWIACLLGAVLGAGCVAGPAVLPVGGQDDGGPADVAVGFDGTAGGDRPPPPDLYAGDLSTSCSRSVNLKAVSIARPVPFDVVIVADNSDSLSWSRDSLSAGLENLLSRVRGHEARFFVLTSTQYGASSQAAVSPFTGKDVVTWRDSVTRAPYARPMTEYKQACTDGKGATISCPTTDLDMLTFTLEGSWQFQMPAPVAAITPAMTEAQVSMQQKRIADAVLSLGGGGAQQEQPICTLSRYLTQKPELLPRNVVFVVLADEDDTSPPNTCLVSYEARRAPSMTPSLEECTSKCSLYVYGVQKGNVQEQLAFTCVPVDDMGMAHPERAVDKSIVVNYFATCTGPPSRVCNASDLARANTACGPGHQIRNCKQTCGAAQGGTFCQLQRPDDKIDLCAQPFDEGGMRYNNLAEYCTKLHGPGWGQCSVQGLMPGTRQLFEESEYATPLVQAPSTIGMIASFKQNADRIFGARGYSVESIVLDPAFSCPVRPGQSYAPNLRQLASSPQDVFPLCQDYAPALQRIQSFADYLVQTAYPLDLNAYEDVDSVLVTNMMGVQRTLRPIDYRYDRAAKILRFNPGVLGAQDAALAVNVARYCDPIK